MLEIEKMGLPLLTTLHHPISFDRRIDIASTKNPWRKFTLSRWYGFVQDAGAGRPPGAQDPDALRDLQARHRQGLRRRPGRMQVILLGVDDVFVPPTKPRVPGRIMAMASADAPMKGIATLLEAFAKLRTERDVELLLVTKPKAGGRTEKLIDKLSISDSVQLRARHQRRRAGRADGLGRAGLRAVALRGLLAADRRADGLRHAAGRRPDAGAIPEVVGPDGLCADLVTPGDVGELEAAIARCSTTPSGGRGTAPPAASGSRSCSAGARSRRRSPAAYEEVIAEYRPTGGEHQC